ncbi:MAG: hypothetical protein WC340_04735 [Kiritimatiellia bacterium]
MKSWMSITAAVIIIFCVSIMIYSWFRIQIITREIPAQKNMETEELLNINSTPQFQMAEKKVAQHNKSLPEQKTIKTAYNIVSTKSHNYHTTYGKYVSHKDYRVVVPVKTTKGELNLIARTITSSESSNINSVLIWFYWPESDPTGVYTAGMATCDLINSDWRIEMKYGQTYSEATPQYSRETETLSLSKRKKIFWDLVVEEDRAGIAGDSEQCRRIIARRYGISVSEVTKIVSEAVSKGWPMPKDPLY